jgi:hypothetical protein
MTPPRDLSGVRVKLDRARAHIDAIGEKTDAFTGRTPPPFGVRSEHQGTR